VNIRLIYPYYYNVSNKKSGIKKLLNKHVGSDGMKFYNVLIGNDDSNIPVKKLFKLYASDAIKSKQPIDYEYRFLEPGVLSNGRNAVWISYFKEYSLQKAVYRLHFKRDTNSSTTISKMSSHDKEKRIPQFVNEMKNLYLSAWYGLFDAIVRYSINPDCPWYIRKK